MLRPGDVARPAPARTFTTELSWRVIEFIGFQILRMAVPIFKRSLFRLGRRSLGRMIRLNPARCAQGAHDETTRVRAKTWRRCYWRRPGWTGDGARAGSGTT